jgi:hypothetical protein
VGSIGRRSRISVSLTANLTNDWRKCVANCMMHVGEAIVRQNSCQSA